jgi:hypothetical protein
MTRSIAQRVFVIGNAMRLAALRRRSLKAMQNYVENLDTLKSTIDFACRILKDAELNSR